MTRVLVVEDHTLVRDALVRLLTDGGFEVRGVADANSARTAAATFRPHVALVDIGLPDGDGITLVADLRRLSPDTRPVMLTMYTDPATVGRAISAGAAGYLSKDVPAEEVLAAVEAVLAGKRVLGGVRAPAEGRRPPSPATRDRPELAPRQIQILQLLADGLTAAEVAERLALSPKTIRNLLSDAYRRLGVADRTEAVVEALRLGLIALRTGGEQDGTAVP